MVHKSFRLAPCLIVDSNSILLFTVCCSCYNMIMDDAWWIGSVEHTSFDKDKHHSEREIGTKLERFFRNCIDQLDSTCSKLCPSRSSICWKLEEGTAYRDHTMIGSPYSRFKSTPDCSSQENWHNVAEPCGSVRDDWTFTIDDDGTLDDIPLNPYHSRVTPPSQKRLPFPTHKAKSLRWSCHRTILREKTNH